MKRFPWVLSLSLLVAGLMPSTPLFADIALPSLFSDNMIFQQGMPLTLWGTAAKGEKITASFPGREIASTVADDNGHWKITGAAPKAGPLPDLTLKGANTLVLKNLLAGEVWLCSGQSNMAMTVSASHGLEIDGVMNEREEVQNANHPEIRFFDQKWEICSPATVGNASATAYFFGRMLQEKLKTPVGLLIRAKGGTAIEYWMAPAEWTDDLTHKAVEAYRPLYAFLQEENAKRPNNKKNVATPETYPKGFSKLYRLYIDDIAGFPVAGMLWYQGESNAPRCAYYDEELEALIHGWREAWHEPAVPFLVVQLPNFEAHSVKSDPQSWVTVRQKQAAAVAATPNAKLIVGMGAGDTENLHPKNKQEMGRRAALAALGFVYHHDVPESPSLKNTAWNGASVTLTFDHAPGGLVVKDGPQPAFELAGADGVFKPAESKVSGETVTVSSRAVAHPVTLRYAWANAPTGLLYNQDGLAVAPIRIEKK